MKRVIFFTENKWAFGSIHYGLVQRLMHYGIDAEVLDFFTQYTEWEMQLISDNTDLFVTTPVGVGWLLKYNIDPTKIASIAHGQWDIFLGAQQNGLAINSKLAKVGVVSEILKQKSGEIGVPVVPDVIPFGINFDRFYSPISASLTKVGLGGAFASNNIFGVEIKRGHLVLDATLKAGLTSYEAKTHYLGMPGFYRWVDAVVMASTEEGAGLPMMEAAAAGRLTLGTAVGYFEKNGPLGGGITLPTASELFVEELVHHLHFFNKYPAMYQKTCAEIQEYARHTYDWSFFIARWVEFLYAAVR